MANCIIKDAWVFQMRFTFNLMFQTVNLMHTCNDNSLLNRWSTSSAVSSLHGEHNREEDSTSFYQNYLQGCPSHSCFFQEMNCACQKNLKEEILEIRVTLQLKEKITRYLKLFHEIYKNHHLRENGLNHAKSHLTTVILHKILTHNIYSHLSLILPFYRISKDNLHLGNSQHH